MQTGENEYTLIPVNAIDPNTSRVVHDEAEDNVLAENIRINGLLQPIVLRKHPDDKNRYIIIVGNRRLRAYKMLASVGTDAPRFELIPARIVDVQQLLDLTSLALSENMMRVGPQSYEIGAALHALKKECVPSICSAENFQDLVVQRLGIAKSKRRIAQLVSFFEKAPPELRNAVKAKTITMKQAETMLRGTLPLGRPSQKEKKEKEKTEKTQKVKFNVSQWAGSLVTAFDTAYQRLEKGGPAYTLLGQTENKNRVKILKALPKAVKSAKILLDELELFITRVK